MENMIENFKKGFDGDCGRKMAAAISVPFVKSNGLQWGLAGQQRGTMDLNLIKAVYAIVTEARTPRPVPVHRLLAEWPRAPPLVPRWAPFYAHGAEGKILTAQKVTRMRGNFTRP